MSFQRNLRNGNSHLSPFEPIKLEGVLGNINPNSRNMQTTTAPELKGTSQIRRFCFTINNWTDAEYQALKDYPCKWMVVGKEKGENGTPHLQGAVVLGKAIRFNVIKKTYAFTRAHIEKMGGTPADSLTYCTKEDKAAFIKGEMPNPGKRNDIHKAVQMLREQPNISELLANDDFASCYIKYSKGLTLLSETIREARKEPPTVFWIHGETGSGKTRRAVDFANDIQESFWISHGGLQWFDGYCGQSVAILDDFRTGHCQFSFLLRLLDRYPLSVPFKGGYSKWTPKYIIVTAPYEPRRMFNLRNEGDIQQLERRITHVVSSDLDGPSLSELAGCSLNREEASVVEDPTMLGDIQAARLLINLGTTGEESSTDTDELSYESAKDLIEKPELKRTRAYADLEDDDVYEPPQKKAKKLVIDLSK